RLYPPFPPRCLTAHVARTGEHDPVRRRSDAPALTALSPRHPHRAAPPHVGAAGPTAPCPRRRPTFYSAPCRPPCLRRMHVVTHVSTHVMPRAHVVSWGRAQPGRDGARARPARRGTQDMDTVRTL